MPTATPILPPSPFDARIAFISSYPPRRCGIATYTKDLATGINNLNPDRLAEIIALDDPLSESLEYPWEVSHRIHQNEWGDYEKVLDYLNNSTIDMVSIQHEYGIYGGEHGAFLVDFVKQLKKPFIVTLHTILTTPGAPHKAIIQELCSRAAAVVVMLPSAVDILRDIYGVAPEKVVAIHHGAPDFPFEPDVTEVKKELGLAGRVVMSSVNLISASKCLEYAIEALPAVVKQCPEFLYLIVGQTHPVVLKNEGEVYREKLQKLARDLGVEDNVRFINEYVTLEQLVDYVRASDFYITPYEGLEQISSGSLAYAIAAGKLCISTPYRYATEMLAGGRGYLVEPQNTQAISDALLHALNNPYDAERMRRKCYAQGRRMTWARVGFRHVRLIDHLIDGGNKGIIYPYPTLSHVRAMTDDIGMLEHTRDGKPDLQEGYSVDDNARALIAALQYRDTKLAQKYLNFLCRAEDEGRMYCDLDVHGNWTPRPGDTEHAYLCTDWHGRALWAAAYAVQHGRTVSIRNKATELVCKLLPHCEHAHSIRTQAFVLLGLACLQECEWEEMQEERAKLLEQMLESITTQYHAHADASWHWPEDKITYDNPRIPHALLEVSRVFNREDIRGMALRMLDFLLDQTYDIQQNHFRFVGNNGWYPKGGKKALFDEQPIEAGATVQACYAAYLVTGLNYYREMLHKAFAWFHGDNILRRSLYNPKNESIYDGIRENGLNMNQGAECILEYLLAYKCYTSLIEQDGLVTLNHPVVPSRSRAISS